MTPFEPYKWAKCPLPGCGEDLVMSLSYPIYVDDVPLTHAGAADMDRAEWQTTCANGHVVDSGGPETDGRTALHGHRNAQSLGGLR